MTERSIQPVYCSNCFWQGVHVIWPPYYNGILTDGLCPVCGEGMKKRKSYSKVFLYSVKHALLKKRKRKEFFKKQEDFDGAVRDYFQGSLFP